MGKRVVRTRRTSQPELFYLLLGLPLSWALFGLVVWLVFRGETGDLVLFSAVLAASLLAGFALWFDRLVVDETDRTVRWRHFASRRQAPFEAFDAVEVKVVRRWRDGRVRHAMAPAKVDTFRVYLVGEGRRVLAMEAQEDGLGARELADELAEMMDIPVRSPV